MSENWRQTIRVRFMWAVGRAAFALALYTASVSAPARGAPSDPRNFEAPVVGFFQLQNGTVIEGSRDFGGKTPDFRVDWDHRAFDPLREFARGLKARGLSASAIADEIRAYLRKNVFKSNSLGFGYQLALKLTDFDGAVSLSTFVEKGTASCRETSYVMHLAMTEAGVTNRIVYARINEVVENANDHSFVTYLNGKVLTIADGTNYGALHGVSVESAVGRGKVVSLNLFPRVWRPLKTRSATKSALAKMSYPEFEDLVRTMAGKVPDLDTIWRLAKSSGHDVRVGGGVLRGLLRWIGEAAQTKSVDEIKRMTPPPTALLLLNREADKDIYASSEAMSELKSKSAVNGWDFVDDRLFDESIAAGGTTLDKIRVNPDRVDDPLGGLRAFYEGKLEYKIVPPHVLQSTYWFREKSNSETAMILRYLRMREDFPELEVDPGMRDFIRKVAGYETPRLGKNHFYWIQKGLGKLFSATYGDAATTSAILQNYGILAPLSGAGYRLPLDNTLPVNFTQLTNLGFDADQVRSAQNLFNFTYGSAESIYKGFNNALTAKAATAIIDRGAPLLISPGDFITAFTSVRNETKWTREVRGKALVRFAKDFMDRGATAWDVRKLLTVAKVPDKYDLGVYEIAARRMTSAYQYAILFEALAEFNNDKHNQTRSRACANTIDHFATLGPSAHEARMLLINGKFPDKYLVDGEILLRAGRVMKTADEFIALFLPFSGFASKTFQNVRTKALIESIDSFFALKPTEAQIARLLRDGRFNDSADGEILLRAKKLWPKATYDRYRKTYPKARSEACARLLQVFSAIGY